jgi:tripartite-type tricarboxylate transporter receptor subunit TctC
MKTRRVLLNGAVCVAAFGVVGLAPVAAQTAAYPSKPIRFIVPYATGGSTTNIARLIGQRLTEVWGQPVLVDNRPGANTTTGTLAAARSPGDGYTILLGVSSHVLIPILSPTAYHPVNDFTPIASVASTETLLTISPGLPVKNLKELLAFAAARPDGITYATGGAGSATHLAHELFNKMTGMRARHIPYKGAAPALVDLAGGQVDISFAIPGSAISLVKAGKIRALAVTGDARLPALPDVPTFAELGMPDFKMRQWYGVIAPAGVPPEIANRLATEIARIAATNDFKERLQQFGMGSYIVTGADLGAIMRSESAQFSKIIQDAGIKIE